MTPREMIARALELDARKVEHEAHCLNRPRGWYCSECGPSTEYVALVPRLARELAVALDRIARVEAERDSWKRRAEKHGCNVVDGDPDCG